MHLGLEGGRGSRTSLWALVLLLLGSAEASARSGGWPVSTIGMTSCNGCHSASNTAPGLPTVTLSGPSSLAVGATGSYSLTITAGAGGPSLEAGITAYLSNGSGATLVATDTAKTKLTNGQLVNSLSAPMAAGSITYNWNVTAPATAGSFTLTAIGLACNGSGSGGDKEAFKTMTITVTGAANSPPTVAQAASASPSTVTATTTQLSVLGADNGGEAALVYTWSSTGPAPVSFSSNGTNASKSSVATFSAAGSYTLTATIKDAANATVSSSVNVTVQQTLSSVVVSPANASVQVAGTQQFTATARDQFAAALVAQPAFTWSVTGGSISGTGLYTAPATAGGPFTVTATTGGSSGTASVTVVAGNPPTVATPAAANPAQVAGTTTQLSVLGADAGGEAALVYTWAATAGPAAVSFAPNGTNAAKSSVATFTRAGSYTLEVTIRNAATLTAKSSVAVTVDATVTTISLSPATANVGVTGTQAFTPVVSDQFGQALAAPPVLSWSLSAGCVGCSLSQAGLFTAGTTAGGPFTVTASAAGKSGTATVQVLPVEPPRFVQQPGPGANPVTSKSTEVSVLGDDVKGEATLVYTWSMVSGPAPVAFLANASNAAKTTQADFSVAGAYVLAVQVKNGGGAAVSSSFPVQVVETPTGLVVSPEKPRVPVLGKLQLTSQLFNQFGGPMVAGRPIKWAATNGGSVSSTGLFTAGPLPGMTATVTATLDALVGTLLVEIAPPGDDVEPPQVSLQLPLLSELKGTVLLRALAEDTGGLATVAFLVDEAEIAVFSRPSYQALFDTTALPDGPHTFTARAVDLAGNEAVSQLTVEVHNGAPERAGCSATPEGPSALPWMLLLAATSTLARRRGAAVAQAKRKSSSTR